MSMKLMLPQRRGRSLAILAGLLALLSLSACGDNTVITNPTTINPTTGAATTAARTSASPTTTTAGITTTGTTTAATSANATTVASAPTSVAATSAAATTAASTKTSAGTTSADTSPKVVVAANAFLATLDSTQKAAVLFDWTNTAQKARWSNFPNRAFSRAGLVWGNLWLFQIRDCFIYRTNGDSPYTSANNVARNRGSA